MIVFVLHNPAHLDEVLQAWDRAGVKGTTVLFSVGFEAVRKAHAMREDLPLMPSAEDFQGKIREMSRTLFTVVEDEAVQQKVIAATLRIVGDLDKPDTGILAVLPVSEAYGLHRVDR
jgi:nitrogen regulatory protein PII